MPQCLLKGHKMLDFIFTFLLKISETLKAHIYGMETDINFFLSIQIFVSTKLQAAFKIAL